MEPGFIFACVFTVGFIIYLAMSVRIVAQGNAYIVERLGQYRGTLGAGLHCIMPILDRVRAKVDIMPVELTVPAQRIQIQNGQAVTAEVQITYQITNPPRSVYQVANVKDSLLKLAITQLQTEMGGMTLNEVLASLASLNGNLQAAMAPAADAWGVTIIRVELQNVTP